MIYRFVIFLLFTVVFSFCGVVLSEEKPKEPSDVITLVATENNIPFSFLLPDGTPSGLYVEFWELWSKTNNIPIQFELMPFVASLKRVRNKNKVHVGLFKNKHREQWADFSLPIHQVKTGVIYNRGLDNISSLRELTDERVAVQHLSYQESYLRENYPDLTLVPFSNFNDVFSQLLENNVQAVVGELPIIYAQLAVKGLSGVFQISSEEIISNYVFALMTKEQPELLAKINAGIENIPVNKIVELEKKWLPTLKPFFNDHTRLKSLTLAEIKWLKQLPTLKLGTEVDWYPYEYLDDNGDYSGLTTDYIQYIENLLSLSIEVDRNYSWVESLTAINQNKIDLISAISKTKERAEKMLFTEPYFSAHTVLVSRKSGFNADSLESLKGLTLAIPIENVLSTYIASSYPEITIITVDSTIDGLRKLNEGKFDAFINDISIVNHVINTEQLTDLIITGFSPYKLNIRMAVRTELEPLVGILNKVFLNMSEKEKVSIANNWLAIQIKTGIKTSTVILWALPIVSFLLVIILIFVRLNQRLKVEILGRQQSEDEQRLLTSQLHQSQKMDALGKLTGGIAHDFNNILGIILGYSELIKVKISQDDHLISYVDHVAHAGERGAKLTNKLMSFSRIKNIEAKLIDINDLLIHQKDMLEKTITVRIKLIFKLGSNIWPLWLDPNDLEDAILNLSINAMHAMSDNVDTAKLMIKTENLVLSDKRADELGMMPGDFVKLCLSDNGCGMSEETQKNIFDPFFSTKGDKGTGLGLSQVFGFVQRSGGTIVVNSSFENGTAFTLYFPRFIDYSNNETTESQKDEIHFNGSETILVVDDELPLTHLATEILEEEGYTVITAISAVSALDILDTEQIDLVLTDIIMPEMDGYQLAKKIKEKHATVKVQLVSGFSDEKKNTLLDDLKITIIHKPYNRQVLLRAIRNLLDT